MDIPQERIDKVLENCRTNVRELLHLSNEVVEEMQDYNNTAEEVDSWVSEIAAVRALVQYLTGESDVLPSCLRDSPIEYVREQGIEVPDIPT